MESLGKKSERKEELFNKNVEYFLSRNEKGLRQVVKMIEEELDSLDTDEVFRKHSIKIKELIGSKYEEIKELQETGLKYEKVPVSKYTNLKTLVTLQVDTINSFKKMAGVVGLFIDYYEEFEEKEKAEEVEKIKDNIIEMWREVVHFDSQKLKGKI